MTSNLQQLKLQLSSLLLANIGCNSLNLTELRIKKHQQQTKHLNDSISVKENLNDSYNNHEERANKLFEVYL
ncbi:5085_t:CDS:2 [Cetraspora pellucida]|uniref:5085_t:CDS:1 n=1 Tax=Cetraspora pellucida TaxID=1433469 RepID=A0A9N9BW09_9GLOM|nr:5085_t:CDS:2 [Cetraspora pellucida]